MKRDEEHRSLLNRDVLSHFAQPVFLCPRRGCNSTIYSQREFRWQAWFSGQREEK